MTARDHSVWQQIIFATPPDLLFELLKHLVLYPNTPVPADLQRRLGKEWEKRA